MSSDSPNTKELTLKPDTDSVRNTLDSLRPQSLVELRVEADVGGAHRLLCEVDDRLDSPRCALLERAAVHPLVEVDGVLASHDILERGALAGLHRFQSLHRAFMTIETKGIIMSFSVQQS